MELDEAFCQLYRHSVEVIGRRWSGAIVRTILAGNERFGQIKESIPQLSDSMLATRLRELEDEGIVARSVDNSRPPQVSYRLTAKGRDLEPVIVALTDWAERWVDPTSLGLAVDTHTSSGRHVPPIGAKPALIQTEKTLT